MEKVKREPTCCLKCQGWHHHAHECTSVTDKCGSCAGNHRTSQCPTPLAKACVSCGEDGHSSWSRNCPTFLKKVAECDSRNPENLLTFFPTSEAWTWTSKEVTAADRAPLRRRAQATLAELPRATAEPTTWKKLGPYPGWDTDLPPSRSWSDDEPAANSQAQ